MAALEAQLAAVKAQLEDVKALIAMTPANAAQVAPNAVAADTKTGAGDPHDFTFAVALDTYYDFNFNRPIGRVNLLRAYDVLSNNFSLNQANAIVESVPDLDAGRRFGGRLDLQYGQATETLQGSGANEPRPWAYSNIFQAYGTLVLPVETRANARFTNVRRRRVRAPAVDESGRPSPDVRSTCGTRAASSPA